MLKSEYFLNAMKAEEFRRTAWVIAAFSLTSEDPAKWKTDNYPYRLVQLPTGFWFVDPENRDNLIQIEGVKAGEPLFRFKEEIHLKAKSVPNLKKDITTTYGNLLVNYTSIIWPFGEKIEYIEGEIKARQIESMIAKRLRDTPKQGEKRSNEFIYVDESLKFTNSMFFLAGFSQLCVPAGSRKLMTVSPDVIKLRDKLIKENEGHLNDPEVIAKIDAQLVQADKDWIKGDPAEHFLLYGKAYNIVRRRLFLQVGAEMGLDDKQTVAYIPRSLSEGLDPKHFPAMNNALRAGSFNRGAETQLGGESVKWLLRASSNMAVTKDDCGSKLGNEVTIDSNKDNWIGFTVITNGGGVKLTEDNIGQYMGKTVSMRSPMYCKLSKTDFCKTCVGDRLASNPTALSAAVAQYGNDFLLIYLAAAHGRALLLAKMDYRKVIV
jgi:hypothetical protein